LLLISLSSRVSTLESRFQMLATAGKRIIWNEAGGDQDEGRQSRETVSKHGVPP
jgi:hypothetical protein